jgi:hypothetical protein
VTSHFVDTAFRAVKSIHQRPRSRERRGIGDRSGGTQSCRRRAS